MYIHDFFVRNGYNVSIHYSENADDDFILLSNAPYFLPSGGGYSFLLQKMCLLNNSIVL